MWELTLPKALADAPLTLQFTQDPHAVGGFVREGSAEVYLRDLTVRGGQVRFGLLYRSRLIAFEGTVDGKTMIGVARTGSVREPWTARYLEQLQR
jgi:hypothetical protein